MRISSMNYSLAPSRVMLSSRGNAPTVAPQPQAPTQQQVKSIYFGNNDDNGRSMQKATMVLLPLSIAASILAGCGDKEVVARAEALAVDSASATATATAEATATANANANDTVRGDGCHHGDSCGNGKTDTLYITEWDTCYIDTGSYHHDVDTVYMWKDRYERPLPLDTLTKHMVIFDVDDADSVNNRNIIHYEYTREWEYNNRVIANMNVLESDMNKNILVHDTEVKDYKGNHKYYGKEVRRIPDAPVVLKNKDGKEVRTKNGIFLEIRKNPDDVREASIFDTELENRYFLQTAGDSVKVYELEGGNRYVEKGKMAKGYLGDNTILLKNGIGRYATEDHLVDVKVVGVNDDTLKEMYARARDNESPEAASSRAFIRRRFD